MSQHSGSIHPGSKYTVQSGDTLWDIAHRAYGDTEDWDTIYSANKQVIGNNPNLIKPGQVLQIPPQADPTIHKPVPTAAPTTHAPTTQPPTTHPPTTSPPPPTTLPPSGGGEDSDSPLDWVEQQLGEKKED